MMESVNLVQNSEEWLKLRAERLGASDANIIMGCSKHMTPNQLLEQKSGKIQDTGKKKSSFVTDKGHRLEEKIRAMIELDLGIDFPPLIALSSEFPFLMASLDGYNDAENLVLECKYVGADDFETVQGGKNLDHYYPQIQQQMLVTGAEKCILAVAKEGKDKKIQYAYVEVKFDLPYVTDKLLPALQEFWQKVQDVKSGKEVNQTLVKGDVLDQSSDKELCLLLSDYKVMSDELEKLSSKVESIKDEIFATIKHDKVTCGDATIHRIPVAGKKNTDYKTFLADNKLVIPEKYISIGNPSTQYKITFKKD